MKNPKIFMAICAVMIAATFYLVFGQSDNKKVQETRSPPIPTVQFGGGIAQSAVATIPATSGKEATTTAKEVTTAAKTTLAAPFVVPLATDPGTIKAPTTTIIQTIIFPGAFCTPAGAFGRSDANVLYQCVLISGEDRPHWRIIAEPPTTTLPVTTIPIITVAPVTTVAPITTIPITTIPVTTATTTTTVAPLTIPAPPGNFTAKILAWISSPTEGQSQDEITASWVDQSTNETGFRIYEDSLSCPGLTGTVLLATVPANTASWIGSAYDYMGRGCLDAHVRIVAFNTVGESGPKGPYDGLALVAPVPNVPTIVSYTPTSATQATIVWRHDPVMGFRTYEFIFGDSLGSPLTGNLTYTTTILSSGSTIEYSAIVPITSCATIRARNTYTSTYDWRWSALSVPFC
jgi:hypothetical protein